MNTLTFCMKEAAGSYQRNQYVAACVAACNEAAARALVEHGSSAIAGLSLWSKVPV